MDSRSLELHFQILAIGQTSTEAYNVVSLPELRYLQEESYREFWHHLGGEISSDWILPFIVVICGLANQSMLVQI